MNSPNPDRPLERLLHRAIVRRGLRPQTDEQIVQMLDTIGGAPVDDEKLQRMLRKINREEPVGPAPKKTLPYSEPALTENERELIALHRSQGKALTPELERKLRALEARAAGCSDSGGTCDGR